MSHKGSKDRNLNTELNSHIDTLESCSDNNMDCEDIFNFISQNIDDKPITPNIGLYVPEFTLKKSRKPIILLILYRISDSVYILILALLIFLIIISLMAFICEFLISFYSVIMMNYVFFVSSIVSYIMAPIYQSLSRDWINFAFSLAQVFLSSPLIAFYIFYIMKSVVSLASIISDIPKIFKDVFFMFHGITKDIFFLFFSRLFSTNYNLIFKCASLPRLIILFFIVAMMLGVSGCFAYVLFCLDKTIILFGAICYLITTFQIFMLILPSYLYFFQCIFCRKCKEIKLIEKYINFANEIYDLASEEEEEDNNNDDDLFGLKDEEPLIIPDNILYSDGSDAIMDYKFKMISSEESDDKQGKTKKIIDDSFISDYADDEKISDEKYMNLVASLVQLVVAKDYISLYYYSTSIAFDKHKKVRKIFFMYFFLILNLFVISYDIYQLTQNYSAYFLSSVIIRFLFIPLLSYYNIFSVIFNRAKDRALNIVLYISSILTILITIAILICFIFTNGYKSKFLIHNLEYYPTSNITIPNEEMLNHPICDYKIFNVSAFDAFGYSLGGYDIKRNKTIFDNQMKTFFGEDYAKHISYTVNELLDQFLMIRYYDSSINTYIYAFRGYSSGPEVAFQFELLAMQYVIPFFEDIVPFYDFINEYWLGFYTDFLISFGLSFFDNNNLIVKYVNSIIDVYNKEELKEEKNVIFAGINSGGAISKIVGTILHRKSISFISFPINNDLFQRMFDFSSSYLSLATNVYNVNGFFSDQEPAYSTNIGINLPVFDSSKFCTSGICEINSKTDNVYRTFCTMSELCGRGNQFNYYCEKIIGKVDLETIRESIKDSE